MTSYLPVGDYIGQLIRPAAATPAGIRRIPLIVGKGSRLAEARNSEIVRGRVYDEALSFSGTGPYLAVLANVSGGKKSTTTLTFGGGVRVEDNKYQFGTTVVPNDTIIISTNDFDPTTEYIVTYDSSDSAVLDPVPYGDLRQVLSVGRGVDSADWTEFVDFFVPVDVADATAGSGNTYTAGATYGSTNGTAAKATLDGPSTEDIVLTMAADGISVVVVAGGAEAFTENTGTNTVTLTYITGTSTKTSLRATISSALSGLTLVTAVATGTGATTWTSKDQTVLSSRMDNGTRNAATTGNVFFSPTSAYSHKYSRDYIVECVAAGAAGVADFVWYSAPVELGNDMVGHNPPHVDFLTTGIRNLITNPADNADNTLEYGVKIRVNDAGGAGFTVGDRWTFRAFAPGAIEASPLHSNTNQFLEVPDAPTEVSVDAGTSGVLTVHLDSKVNYNGDWNRTYTLVVSAISAGTSVTFKWNAVGDDGIATGTTSAILDGGTATLDKGIKIAVDISAGDFTVGDRYSIAVLAPRVVPAVKDDRTLTFEIVTATAGNIVGTYVSDTTEGGSGTFTATTAAPDVTFNGQLTVMVRNLLTPRLATGDDFTLVSTLSDTIDWSLLRQVSETFAVTELITDTLGAVTGTAGSRYFILRNVPDELVYGETGAVYFPSSNLDIVQSGGANTRYVKLASGTPVPTAAVTVTYRWAGSQPRNGDTYRWSAQYLRGADLYNTPILVTSADEAKKLLAPLTPENHLAIFSQIAWEMQPPGFFICQVADADMDGVYQDSDYDTAIDATIDENRVTDLVVLDRWGTLNTQIGQIDTLADPLRAGFRMMWTGAPIDTLVGDEVTSGTLAYTARNTFAVYGDNPAHGSRVLVAPTWCKRTVVLANGRSKQLTLDGSFVAGAMCIQYAAFEEPWMTVLRTNLTVFDEIQTFTVPEIRVLGAAQINYLSDVGSGVYRWQEDVTTDPVGTEANSTEFAQINAMVQKWYMQKVVHIAVDSTIISLTPQNAAQGVDQLRNVISGAIREAVANGKCGDFMTEGSSPTVRKFNAATDVRVFRDATRQTVFRYFYCFFIRNTIKNTFGLYLVDTNDFGV